MIRDCDYYMIQVDEVRDGTPIGQIINPCLPEAIEFHDLGDMILKINQTMLRLKIKMIQFDELFTYHTFRDFSFTKSPQYFFLVRMIRCDEITWHGVVEGSSGHREGFKSALDLMGKIDSVIRDDSRKIRGARGARG